MNAEDFQEPVSRLRRLFSPSQNKTLVLISLAIGFSTGMMVFLFEIMIRLVQSLFLNGDPLHWTEVSWKSRIWLFIAPAVGGLLVGPLTHFLAPEAKGDGVPQVMYAVNRQGGKIRARVGFLKAIASALTLGSGGSAGREGPIVQIGASIGSTIGRFRRLPENYIKTMAAAGAGAGIAAAFNAPLAGVFFALEVILVEFTSQAFSMVVLSSVIASFVSRGLSGNESYFFVPSHDLHEGIELILYAVLGVLAAVTAQIFIWFLQKYEDAFEELKMTPWLKPALGGLLVGIIAFWFPQVMGSSHGVVELALENKLAVWLAGVLILAKMAATSFSLGSGGSGGVFMPSLAIGAMLGGWFGGVMGSMFPNIASPGAYALVGMGAVFAAMTHAPMTAILILFEMTYDYGIILPVMTGVVIAVMASSALRPENVYTLPLIKKGITLKPKIDHATLARVLVREAMTEGVETIKETLSLEALLHIIEKDTHTGFPVVNRFGDIVGLLTYAELHQALENHDTEFRLLVNVRDIMRTHPPKVTPDDSLQKAMELMHQHQVDRIPVVDPDDPKRLLGIVTKGDVASTFYSLFSTK